MLVQHVCERGEILFRAGQLLIERKEDLSRLMTMEMGKVLAEARGDVQEAIDMTFYMAAEGRRLEGRLVPSELPNKWAMAVRDPIGVVRGIYAHFDMRFTEAAELRMRRFLAENPKDKHGRHEYTLEEFGLDQDEERQRYAWYRDRFGL